MAPEKNNKLSLVISRLLSALLRIKLGCLIGSFRRGASKTCLSCHVFSTTLLRTAVLKLGTNKSSHEDALVGEFFKELDDTNLEIIGELFRAKLLNVGGGGA